MESFLVFYNKIKKSYWALEIYHSSIVDWSIRIGYKYGFPKHGEYIVSVQDCDIEMVFAKAQVALKEWLCTNEGGY